MGVVYARPDSRCVERTLAFQNTLLGLKSDLMRLSDDTFGLKVSMNLWRSALAPLLSPSLGLHQAKS